MIKPLVKNEAPSLLDTEKANELINAINGLFQSRGENGIIVKSDDSGSLIISADLTSSIRKNYNPFEVISTSDSSVLINAGLVNGVIVSNVEVANSTGTRYICLDIDADDTGVTSVDLVSESSAPDGIEFIENGVNTNFKYCIAIVNGNEVISQLVNNNLFFTVNIAFEQPKASITMGEYPNNIYYTWIQTVG